MAFQPYLRPSMLLFRATISAFFAAFCLLAPRPASLFFSVAASAFLLADAAAAFLIRSPDSPPTGTLPWALLSGFLSAFVGAFVFIHTTATSIDLTYASGAWAFLTGALQVTGAGQAARDPTASRMGRLLFGVGGVAVSALGVFIFFQPWLGIFAFLSLLGLACLALAASHVALGLGVQRFLRQSAPPAEREELRRSA